MPTTAPTTVSMLAPDGSSGEIPLDKVQAAQQAGFKRAFEMTAPDGKTTGYIPQERVLDAAKSGFRLAGIDKNDHGEGTYNMWDDAGHKLPIPYSHVPIAQAQGYKFDVNPDPDGVTPAQRFQKDSATGLEPRGGWVNGDVARGAVEGVKNMFAHPFQTAAGMGAPFVASGVAPGGMYPTTAATGRPEDAQANAQVQQQAQRGQADAAQFIEKNPAYSVGSVAGPALVTAGIAKGVPMLVDAGASAARSVLAGDVNAPIAGTDLTPAARYESMKSMGLQPNAAEATNSTPLKIAEKVNQNSLTAARTYTDARAANLKALNDYAGHVLDSMSPQEADQGGAAVQKGLRDAQTKLQNDAASGFSELDRAVGNRKLQGLTLQQTAKNIYDANADYYAKHPALAPTNAWKIVKDLAGADSTPSFQSRPMSFPEVHQLRSDLLELVRSNPDIVKNQAGGWLQQLAAAADETMTSGAGGLNPEGTQIFRDANEAWANMKGTYDNPSHPFYHAVRSSSPSTLVKGIQPTPEMARALQTALGPEGIGPIQRGVAENMLRTTKEGGYNFKTFQGAWNKLPEAYRDALFTPEQRQQLEGIGDAGTVLHEDANPSGSARLGQGIAEGAEALKSLSSLHEAALNVGYHAAHYGLAKLMNYPGFVDWLMRGRGFEPIEEAPAAGTAAGAGPDPHIGPLGQPNFYSDEYLRAKAEFDAARAKQ